MQGLVLKIRAWWNIADKTAKTVTVVGVLFLAVTLVVTFVLASRPDYVVLFADLTNADAGRVINKLKDMKVPFRIGKDGRTVEVPKQQRDEVRMKLAAEGLPVESSGIGKGWLDKSRITTTQGQEEQIQRVMLEEELQKTIQTLEPVQAARVHLTFGEQGPFADQQREASASVVVHLRPSSAMTPDQVAAVVHIVSRSVAGLNAKDVSVIDGQGEVLYDGSSQGPGGVGMYNVKRREELAYAKSLRTELERHLTQVLGPGKAVVNVQCTMNFDTEESDKTVNTPSANSNVISELSAESSYGSDSRTAGGVVGATANTPGVANPGGTGGGSGGRSFTETKKQSEYAFDQERLKTVKAPGKIEALHVALLLDEGLDAAQVNAVTNYVNGALGISDPVTPPPGYSVAVAKVKFDEEQIKQAKAQAAAQASATRMERYLGLAPALALIVAAILVMRALGKQSIRLQTPELVAPSPRAETPPPPELPEQPAGEPPLIRYTEPEESPIEIERIPERLDIAREQIVRMAQDKPQTVAMLVKTWMMEDRS
jgi:flagellar M-ring protein FliF